MSSSMSAQHVKRNEEVKKEKYILRANSNIRLNSSRSQKKSASMSPQKQELNESTFSREKLEDTLV